MAKLTKILFAVTVIFSLSPAYGEDITIVAHKDIAINSITKEQVKDIWLFSIKKLPTAGRIKVVDQKKGSTVRDSFYSTITGKTPSQIKSHWAKQMFMGKGYPPKALPGDEEILQWVASTPGGIGYVNKSATITSVKILRLSQ